MPSPSKKRKGMPSILTELPGPAARKILERDQKFVSQSYTRVYPLVVKKASGAWVEDVDSNRYLDFTSGIAVCNTGHCHPRVVEAIQRQAKELIHMSGSDFYYDAQSNLAAKLAEITPGLGEKKVFFGNSGAEAIEAALKLARYHTKTAFHHRLPRCLPRPDHGGPFPYSQQSHLREGILSPLSRVSPMFPFPIVIGAPFIFGDATNVTLHAWTGFEKISSNGVFPPRKSLPSLWSPFRERGYVVPPPNFHQKLYNLAKEFGILFVADEIQSGMGRTGKMMAIEHWGVVPDIIALAKGIASGMPLGAMVAQREVMDWVRGSHASTFGGNPISCEAGLATIELLQGGLIENAKQMGEYLMAELKKFQNRFRLIGDVRGKGLMIGIEMVKDPVTKEKAIEERNQIVQACFEKGLLTGMRGECGSPLPASHHHKE